MKYSKADLKVMQQWPLQRKVQVAQTRIIEWALHHDDNIFVAFSGGLGSTVLLDMCHRIKPNIQLVHVKVNDNAEYKFAASKENIIIIEQEDIKDKRCLRQQASDLILEWAKKENKNPIIGASLKSGKAYKKSGLTHGCNAFTQGFSSPMWYFTENDILEYLHTLNVSFATQI